MSAMPANPIREAFERGRRFQQFAESLAWANSRNGRAVAERLLEVGLDFEQVTMVTLKVDEIPADELPQVRVRDGDLEAIVTPTTVIRGVQPWLPR